MKLDSTWNPNQIRKAIMNKKWCINSLAGNYTKLSRQIRQNFNLPEVFSNGFCSFASISTTTHFF